MVDASLFTHAAGTHGKLYDYWVVTSITVLVSIAFGLAIPMGMTTWHRYDVIFFTGGSYHAEAGLLQIQMSFTSWESLNYFENRVNQYRKNTAEQIQDVDMVTYKYGQTPTKLIYGQRKPVVVEWLLNYATAMCAVQRAFPIMNICLQPTLLFWAGLITFISLALVSIACLAGAGCLYYYYFQKPQAELRFAVNLCVNVAAGLLLLTLLAYGLVTINLSQLGVLTAISYRQETLTTLYASYLIACILSVTLIMIAVLLKFCPIVHPQEITSAVLDEHVYDQVLVIDKNQGGLGIEKSVASEVTYAPGEVQDHLAFVEGNDIMVAPSVRFRPADQYVPADEEFGHGHYIPTEVQETRVRGDDTALFSPKADGGDHHY